MSNAEALYGPDSDNGLRFGGLAPSLTEAAFSEGSRVTLEQLAGIYDGAAPIEDRVEVSQAFIDAGFGPTTSDAVMAAVAAAFHANEGCALSDAEIESRTAAGLAELRREWGADFEAKSARASAVFDLAVKGRPAIENALVALGLTSDPAFVRLLEARGRRAPK